MADMYHALAEIEHAAKSRVYAKHGFRAKAQSHAARAAYHAAFGDPSTSGGSDGRAAARAGGLGLAARRDQMRANTEEKKTRSEEMQRLSKRAERPEGNGTVYNPNFAGSLPYRRY